MRQLEQQEFHRFYLGRYIGQLHSLDVPLDGLGLRDRAPEARRLDSTSATASTYGFAVESETVFVLSLRVRAVGGSPSRTSLRRPMRRCPSRSVGATSGLPTPGFVQTPVYARQAWSAARPLPGPAVIDEYDSTTVVLPGQQWSSDSTGSIVIEEAS